MMAKMSPPTVHVPGRDPIIAADAAGTALFAVTAVLATIVFDRPTRWVAAIAALALFAVGVFVFLWGYWTSVQRSRTEELSVAELYFLVGPPTPKPVKLRLNGLLLVQVAVAVSTALIRSSTDGEPGSSLAFGILTPMFGLGLNGLWAARHGAFGPRRLKETRPAPATARDDAQPPRRSDVPPTDPEMEQNAPHG